MVSNALRLLFCLKYPYRTQHRLCALRCFIERGSKHWPNSSTPCIKLARRMATRSSWTTCRLSFYPRRQDRRRRSQRHGQVDAAQNHGRSRGSHERRGTAHARHTRSASCSRNRRSTRRRPFIENIQSWPSATFIAKIERFNARSARRWPRPTPTSTRSWTRWASCKTEIDAANAWDLGQPAFPGHGRAAVPRPRHARERAFRRRASGAWRCAACFSKRPTCCCSTSPRTTWTPSRCLWLEQFLRSVPRRGAGRHARPLLP